MAFKTTVIGGQSLLDVCIREYGTLEALFVFTAGNALALDQELEPGQELVAVAFELPATVISLPVAPLPVVKKIVASEGQSLLDLAIQETGSLEGLFKISENNGLGVSQSLAAGQVVIVPEAIIGSIDLVQYFSDRKVRINTGSISFEPDGVFWVDEAGFYISDGNDNYILAQL
jgi:hypothetical protein